MPQIQSPPELYETLLSQAKKLEEENPVVKQYKELLLQLEDIEKEIKIWGREKCAILKDGKNELFVGTFIEVFGTNKKSADGYDPTILSAQYPKARELGIIEVVQEKVNEEKAKAFAITNEELTKALELAYVPAQIATPAIEIKHFKKQEEKNKKNKRK